MFKLKFCKILKYALSIVVICLPSIILSEDNKDEYAKLLIVLQENNIVEFEKIYSTLSLSSDQLKEMLIILENIITTETKNARPLMPDSLTDAQKKNYKKVINLSNRFATISGTIFWLSSVLFAYIGPNSCVVYNFLRRFVTLPPPRFKPNFGLQVPNDKEVLTIIGFWSGLLYLMLKLDAFTRNLTLNSYKKLQNAIKMKRLIEESIKT